MPVATNPLEYTLFFTLNQGPGPSLEIWNALAMRTTLAAIRLNVFETLAAGALNTAELAQRLQCDPSGLEMLLKTLEALRYVTQRHGQYALTRMTRKWMISASPTNLAPYVRYWGAILPTLWDSLETSVRTGQTPVNLYEWIEAQPEVSRDFQEAMISLAQLAKAEIARSLSLLRTAHRLLDVGGGHASYSIELCRRYPHLQATVFDAPQPLVVGRQQIQAAGLTERMTVVEGSFFTQELPAGHDVILLFNIVHGLTPTQNEALLHKCLAALPAGGKVIILDQVDEKLPGATVNAVVQLLGLSFFHLLGGRVYPYDAIASWLRNVGFAEVQRIRLLKNLGSSLIVGSKPGK